MTLRSQFVLIAGTTIGLIVVFAASGASSARQVNLTPAVSLLASSASGDLPPTLASVGAKAHSD